MNHKNIWVETFSGRKLHVLDPQPGEISMIDIAHALSLICRFGGHCNVFYSVAQHSLFVSRLLPEKLRAVGLMHDAAEAYIGDMVSPLKRAMLDFVQCEQRIWGAISKRYNLPAWIPIEVKKADEVALVTERRDLRIKTGHDWGIEAEPLNEYIFPISSAKAEVEFLMMAKELIPELQHENI